jgi:hypothetical protein
MIPIPVFVERRIQILLAEARAEKSARQDIKLMMRVISNVATVGKDLGSQAIYKSNPYLSKKAKYALEGCKSFEEWVGNKKIKLDRKVINEHQYPLQDLWNDIRQNAYSYDSQTIWEKFIEYPMVSILIEENAELNNKKYKGLAPYDRYLNAGIEVVKLNTGAYDYWDSLKQSN